MPGVTCMHLNNDGGKPPRGKELYDEPRTQDPKYLYVSVVSVQGPMVGAIKAHTLEVPADYQPEDDMPMSSTPFPKLREMFSAVMQELLFYQDERSAFKPDNIVVLAFSWLDMYPQEDV